MGRKESNQTCIFTVYIYLSIHILIYLSMSVYVFQEIMWNQSVKHNAEKHIFVHPKMLYYQ